jgi:hypothetical protein
MEIQVRYGTVSQRSCFCLETTSMYRLPSECPLSPLLCSRILKLSGMQTTHCSSVCNTSDPQRSFSVMSREACTVLARSRYVREGGGEQELWAGGLIWHLLLLLFNKKTHAAKVKVGTIISANNAASSQPTVAMFHSREYEAMEIEKYLKECIIGAYRPRTTSGTHTNTAGASRASASPVPWSLLFHR